MRFDSLFLELILTQSYLLGIFLLAWALFYLSFVRYGNLTEVQWKKVDYYWLAGAVIGFIGLSSDMNQNISNKFIENYELPHLKTQYTMLRDNLKLGSTVCGFYHKTEASPQTFDEDMAEKKLLCDASKALIKVMPEVVVEPIQTLNELGYKEFQGKYKFNDDYVKKTISLAETYKIAQKRYTWLKQQSEPSGLVSTMQYLSPLLLAIACALRLTKVAAEVRIAKSKESSIFT